MRNTWRHLERHKNHRIGWLRAAVLGANDGIVSTASLVLGVAAAGAEIKSILITGVAGLVAGSMSMAAGEYVSVSSQSDTEQADIEKERLELATQPEHEHAELAGIYVARGLDVGTASTVATQLMAHDALGAHSRDELGISELTASKPLQAAMASALTFAAGSALPLIVVFFTPKTLLNVAVAASSLVFLAALGSLAAQAGGSSALTAAIRVTFWGALAMAITYGVGALFGVAV
jgi:vacuolar iron transporter family protein